MKKKGYIWWQYIGAAILILITLIIAIAIMGKISGKSFSLIDAILGLR